MGQLSFAVCSIATLPWVPITCCPSYVLYALFLQNHGCSHHDSSLNHVSHSLTSLLHGVIRSFFHSNIAYRLWVSHSVITSFVRSVTCNCGNMSCFPSLAHFSTTGDSNCMLIWWLESPKFVLPSIQQIFSGSALRLEQLSCECDSRPFTLTITTSESQFRFMCDIFAVVRALNSQHS